MKMTRGNHGFTLVELMVVVLIIGILIAIAVPIFNAAKATAQKNTCYANQRTIEGSIQTYQARTGSMPATGVIGGTHDLISGGYIKSAPYCPTGGTSAQYSINSSGTVANCSQGTPTHGHY